MDGGGMSVVVMLLHKIGRFVRFSDVAPVFDAMMECAYVEQFVVQWLRVASKMPWDVWGQLSDDDVKCVRRLFKLVGAYVSRGEALDMRDSAALLSWMNAMHGEVLEGLDFEGLVDRMFCETLVSSEQARWSLVVEIARLLNGERSWKFRLEDLFEERSGAKEHGGFVSRVREFQALRDLIGLSSKRGTKMVHEGELSTGDDRLTSDRLDRLVELAVERVGDEVRRFDVEMNGPRMEFASVGSLVLLHDMMVAFCCASVDRGVFQKLVKMTAEDGVVSRGCGEILFVGDYDLMERKRFARGIVDAMIGVSKVSEVGAFRTQLNAIREAVLVVRFCYEFDVEDVLKELMCALLMACSDRRELVANHGAYMVLRVCEIVRDFDAAIVLEAIKKVARDPRVRVFGALAGAKKEWRDSLPSESIRREVTILHERMLETANGNAGLTAGLG